jgi:hypothetical protein
MSQIAKSIFSQDLESKLRELVDKETELFVMLAKEGEQIFKDAHKDGTIYYINKKDEGIKSWNFKKADSGIWNELCIIYNDGSEYKTKVIYTRQITNAFVFVTQKGTVYWCNNDKKYGFQNINNFVNSRAHTLEIHNLNK